MKEKIKYVCKECGYDTIKWMGKCPSCQGWNTFEEFKEANEKSVKNNFFKKEKEEIIKISDIEIKNDITFDTGFEELNKVFGSGIVQNSLILFGGEPRNRKVNTNSSNSK